MIIVAFEEVLTIGAVLPFLAAITFPHVLVILKMMHKKHEKTII